MGSEEHIVVPVSGPLDTVNPVSNRVPGTLYTAIDVAHDKWGARQNRQAQTWPCGQVTTKVAGPCQDLINFNGVVDYGHKSYIKGEFAGYEQRDLGTKWTFSMVFNMLANKAASTIQLFEWRLNMGLAAIQIGVYGTTYVTTGKRGFLYVTITPTSAAGVAGTPYTSESTFAIPFGSAVTDRVYLWVQRDGPTITIWYYSSSNSSTTQTTSFSATQGHEGATFDIANPTTTVGHWIVSADITANDNSDIWFTGHLYKLCMRRGVTILPGNAPSILEHQDPRARDVLLSVVGEGASYENTYGGIIVRDYSKYGSHGRCLSGNPIGGRDDHVPFTKRVQGMGTFIDSKGVRFNTVVAGGIIYYNRMR